MSIEETVGRQEPRGAASAGQPSSRRRPTAAEVAAANEEVPDLLGAGMKLLLVGINPGLWSAASRAHFARPGNRFWPAMYDSGITPYKLDVAAGYQAGDESNLVERGVGLTNIVSRPTARAAELSSGELRAGIDRIVEIVQQYRPRVVAFLGITSYRQAFTEPKAKLGKQARRLATDVPHQVWVLPNPSGLNAHAQRGDLAVAFAAVGHAAGIELREPRSKM